MIRKLLIAVVLLCGVALAQPPQGGPGNGGGFGAGRGQFGPHEDGGPRGMVPPGRWWKNAEVVKAIDLKDDQIQKIEQVFQESRLKLVDIHANLQKEEFKLEPLLQADNPDEKAVLDAIDHIAGARATLEKENARMAFAIRRVLTPEQWKKLRTMRQHRGHFPQPMGGPRGNMHRQGRQSDPPSAQEQPAPEGTPAPESR
jgi:Spy/CpxP family protein refolding chaperone